MFPPQMQYRENNNIAYIINIVTCRLVRVMEITGSSSDDWIY
jgi:hypothetical protein